MLSEQALALKTLTDVLKNRKILHQNDLEAHASLPGFEEVVVPLIEAQVAKGYQLLAQTLGVTTGLPPVTESDFEE